MKHIRGLWFDWDEDKNQSNLVKHGIDFYLAARVFFDQNRVEIYDEKHSEKEDRYQTIGRVRDILFVVYTERHDHIRLISARYATRLERKVYYDQNGLYP